MSPDATWTLITVTYNSSATLEKFWHHAGDRDNSVTWIVVDNGSTDDSVSTARRLGALVVPLGRNVGFGAANNVGFRMSQTPFVAFVNPDVSVDFESLEALAGLLAGEDRIASPQLLNPDGTMQPNGRGLPFLGSKIANRLQPLKATAYRRFASGGETVSVDWLMGAAVLGRRDIFARLGPWDEKFFVYYEDSDLGLRARELGIEMILIGSVQWVHGWARETKHLSWRAWKLEIASMLKFYARYPHLIGTEPKHVEQKGIASK